MLSLEIIKKIKTDKKIYDSIKEIFFGIFLFIGGALFWYYLFGNPFDELALIRHSKTAIGTLINTYVDEREENENTYIVDVGIYAFRSSDGHKYYSKVDFYYEEETEIEYLPENPSVNRAKGDGCQTVTEWLWRKIGVGSIFLTMVLSPGFVLIRNGIIDL